jgi:hypothetical protein
MRITFSGLSDKGIETIENEFNSYVLSQEQPWGGELKKEGDEITLILTTGNKWVLNKRLGELTYEGSRHGFVKLTPFKNVRITKEGLLVYTSFDEHGVVEGWDQLYVLSYETSYPSLKWYERIEQLLQMPEFGVIFDHNGIPLRVAPYKNVYKNFGVIP